MKENKEMEQHIDETKDEAARMAHFGKNRFWDEDSKEDVAEEVEKVYETATGKSCVRWIDGDGGVVETLENRPDDAETRGYTDAYERWGYRKTNEAIARGLNTYADVVDYVRSNPCDGFTVSLTQDDMNAIILVLLEAARRYGPAVFAKLAGRMIDIRDGREKLVF